MDPDILNSASHVYLTEWSLSRYLKVVFTRLISGSIFLKKYSLRADYELVE